MTGKASKVYDALCTHLGETFEGFPVVYPAVDFDPATDAPAGKYFRVDDFPNAPGWQGLSSGRVDRGIFQVAVVWERVNGEQGVMGAKDLADAVIDHFTTGLALFASGQKVTIPADAWQASPMISGAVVTVPVTIPWRA